MQSAAISVRPVQSSDAFSTFIALPRLLYAGMTGFVAPLDFERRQLLDRDKATFFEHGEAQYWLAYRGEQPVGRISAQIDRLGIETWGEPIGLFGCLDAIDDAAVVKALLAEAEEWLRQRGMVQMRGPFTLSINGESGLQTDGQEAGPMVLMPWHPRYLAAHVAAAGLTTAKNLNAYTLPTAYVPVPEVMAIASKRLSKSITLRSLDMKNLARDAEIIRTVFNAAWRNNWGFVPITAAEISQLARSFKPLLNPDYGVIAEANGVPVAITLLAPNVFDIIPDFGGKLLPLNWAKFGYRVLRKDIRRLRVVMFGVVPEQRAGRATLSLAMLERLFSRKPFHQIDEIEMGWVLEDNTPLIHLLDKLKISQLTKRYRIFEKPLGMAVRPQLAIRPAIAEREISAPALVPEPVPVPAPVPSLAPVIVRRPTLTVRPVESDADLTTFIRLPRLIYSGMPGYEPPLDFERRQMLEPRHAKFFEHGIARYFIAREGERPVGRISAQVDHLAVSTWGESIGCFGCIDAIDDQAVVTALCRTAAGWLREQGMTRMRGPFTLSINGESGVQVSGQELGGMVLMPWHPPYLAPMLEGAGLAPVKDLLAFTLRTSDYATIRDRAALARSRLPPALRLRKVDLHNLPQEGAVLRTIFNEAWKKNWSFVPITENEMSAFTKAFKPFLLSDFGLIAELEGKPVAMAVVLPNLFEVVRSFDGQLLPFNWLPFALKALRPSSYRQLRVVLFGIVPSLQLVGASVVFAMLEELFQRQRRLALESIEMSWVLEDNRPVLSLLRAAGVREPSKRYRVFEQAI